MSDSPKTDAFAVSVERIRTRGDAPERDHYEVVVKTPAGEVAKPLLFQEQARLYMEGLQLGAHMASGQSFEIPAIPTEPTKHL